MLLFSKCLFLWFFFIQETNAKLSKFKLQAKAKITSLNAQIQELKKDGDGESASSGTPKVNSQTTLSPFSFRNILMKHVFVSILCIASVSFPQFVL